MMQWETVFNLHAQCALDVLSDLKPYQDNSHFRNGGIHYLSCFEDKILTEKVQLDQSDDITLITHALSYTADPNQAENGIGFCLYLILSCDTPEQAEHLHTQLSFDLAIQLKPLADRTHAPLYREDLWLIGHRSPQQELCLGQFGHTYNQYLHANGDKSDLLLRFTWFAPNACSHIVSNNPTIATEVQTFFLCFEQALKPIKTKFIAKRLPYNKRETILSYHKK